MDLGTILLVVLLLACPLMMLLMHRGGHRHAADVDEELSLDELRRHRDQLDAQIASRERAQGSTPRADDREDQPAGTAR